MSKKPQIYKFFISWNQYTSLIDMRLHTTKQKHKSSFTFSEILINIITFRCFYLNSHHHHYHYLHYQFWRQRELTNNKMPSKCAAQQQKTTRLLYFVCVLGFLTPLAPCAAFLTECARWRELVMIGAPSADPGR